MSIEARAVDLLVSGAVCIPGLRRAIVTGTTDTYEVLVIGDGTIVCPCPGYEYRSTCSHSAAVALLLRCSPGRARSP